MFYEMFCKVCCPYFIGLSLPHLLYNWSLTSKIIGLEVWYNLIQSKQSFASQRIWKRRSLLHFGYRYFSNIFSRCVEFSSRYRPFQMCWVNFMCVGMQSTLTHWCSIVKWVYSFVWVFILSSYPKIFTYRLQLFNAISMRTQIL